MLKSEIFKRHHTDAISELNWVTFLPRKLALLSMRKITDLLLHKLRLRFHTLTKKGQGSLPVCL